jgi:hypothetical protein
MRILLNLVITVLATANVAVLTVTVSSLVGACRSSESPVQPDPPAVTQDPALIGQVPAPALAYVNAVNRNNLDSLVLAFDQTGAVLDVTRRIEGRAAIRNWAGREVMGGTLRVLGVERQTPDRVRLLVHWAPGGSAGWRAYYTFTYADGLITLADLQYA